MQVGDRVRLIGLDGPEGPLGTVDRVLGGNARGMVRVRWHDTTSRVRLHAIGILAPVETRHAPRHTTQSEGANADNE